MRLSKLIACNDAISLNGADIDITGLSEDSRKIKQGYLFIATPGVKQDGTKFIDDAIKNGAVAVLVQEDLANASSPRKRGSILLNDINKLDSRFRGDDAPIVVLTTPNIRRATAELAATFYPRQPETIAAVTGTSGKTSTAQFMRQIWQHLNDNSASIGTLGLATAAGTSYGSLTTPDAITLHHLLDDCVAQNITHIALEASSHGLDLHRLDRVKLKAGGFTNLSRDHLDYHITMEAYLAAKMKLFSDLLPTGAAAVLNSDIPEFEALQQTAKQRGLNIITYGRQAKDLRLADTKPDPRGQILKLNLFGKDTNILLPVIGGFQAYNALCAAGLVIGSGGDADKTIAALSKVSDVPGRLQFIGTSSKGGAIFVDYAHKPDALENVLRAMRPHAAAHHGKLAVIFGCGGNRDMGKRPMMGAIAQQHADWVIVSDDNPRHEDPTIIRAEILAGCVDRSNVTEIGDRATAIAAGIDRLEQHDVLIIAGKGHEPGQIIGDTVLPFDDAEEARKVLGKSFFGFSS